MHNRIIIHTDGSAVNRPDLWNSNHGGCGVVLDYNEHHAEYIYGSFRETTSARMEIFAIIKALEICTPGFNILIKTDNQYCKNTIVNNWFKSWIQRGEHLKSKQDPTAKKNMDLWIRFQKIYDIHISKGSQVEVMWVRGHDGDVGNELADELAGRGRVNRKIITDDRNGIYEVQVSN